MLELVSQAAAEPVSLDDAKAYLRVDTGDDDRLIAQLVTAARVAVERIKRRPCTAQTWRWTMDRWDVLYGEIDPSWVERWWPATPPVTRLPFPADAISSVTVDGVAVDAATYALAGGDRLAWLSTPAQPTALAGGIVVTFTVDGRVDESVRTAIKMLVAWWYEQRTPVSTENATIPRELDYTIKTLVGGRRPRSMT